MLHDEPINLVGFCGDHQLLATCRSATHVWDSRTGKLKKVLPFRQSAMPTRDLSDLHQLVSPDGKIILHSAGFGSFRLWHADTLEPIGRASPIGKVQQSCFAFSPDSRFVLVGHQDGLTQIWDVASMQPYGAPVWQPLGVCAVVFAVDGREFRTIAADGSVRKWRTPTPLSESVEEITQATQLMTGMRLDSGDAVVPLQRSAHARMKHHWVRQHPRSEPAPRQTVADQDWHDARAADGEQSQTGFTTRWHLNRLIRDRTDDWTVFARRAHSHIGNDNWKAAEADYKRVAQLASLVERQHWYWYCANQCCERRQWKAAIALLQSIGNAHAKRLACIRQAGRRAPQE